MHLEKINNILVNNNLDLIFSNSPQTRLWYSNISASDGYIAIQKNKATLFVDSRYYEYATQNATNVEVVLLEKETLKNYFNSNNFKRIGFESNYVTHFELEKLKKLSPNSYFYPVNAQEFRIIKSNVEIEKIQKAIDISLESYELAIKNYLVEGVSEKELSDKLLYLMRRKGAETEGFPSIVAFGPNAAEPHHHSGERKLENGDIVKIDFGAIYKGYCADITRTTFFKPEIKKPNEKLVEILKIVEEAAELGRNFVKPGVKASEVDKICRDYIESKGYKSFFLHSTGHGLGIDVHELPNVNQTNDYILEPGMVITIEPGIYIKGMGGARIEDDVLVTDSGRIILSRKNEN